MTKSLDYKGASVHYTIEGSGTTLFFLHGYLESSEIWNGFTNRFTGSFRVICMDIPGHGRSGLLGEVHEMGEMARVAAAVLDAEGIEKAVMIGHSMGGYVTMEFVHQFPARTLGYCLFHSTCFADNEEKRQNREREISLILCGKKLQIIRTNIPKAFADENLESMKEPVARAIEVASGSSEEGTVALLRGMMNRSDHSDLLKRTLPVPMIIWGERDNYIGREAFGRLVGLAPHATVTVLKNSGHMGFIEEPGCAYSGLLNYLASLH
jgi:pimeloyl-ACP methyl ester carboxylesterase